MAPRAPDRRISIGSEVLFYREKLKTWDGPYLVIAGEYKKLLILIKGQMKEVSIDKVKPYHREHESNSLTVTKRKVLDMDETMDKIESGELLNSFGSKRESYYKKQKEINGETKRHGLCFFRKSLM